MEGVDIEVCHPVKNITVGFVTSMKFGISDEFPGVKSNGDTTLELQKKQTKIL
jgi:hypothetical protein